MQVLGYSFRGLGLRALDCGFAWGSGLFRACDLGFRVEHMGMHIRVIRMSL